MSLTALESIPPDADAFKRVYRLLAADFTQLREQLRTSNSEILKQLSDTLDQDAAIRKEHNAIYRLRLQTSRTLVALLDVDCSEQLNAALAAVTYTDGFELANVNRSLPKARLCVYCKELVRECAVFTDSQTSDRARENASKSTKEYHKSFFQLIDCCYGTKPGYFLCQIIWRSLEILRSHSGFAVDLRLEPFKISTWHSKELEAQFLISNNSESTFLLANLHQIKTWLHKCLGSHRVCRRNMVSSPFTSSFCSEADEPTRLVQFDWFAGIFRVVEPGKDHAPYVTLSYRWGDPQGAVLLTTKTSHELQSKSGVSISELPKTIRDACYVCHYLGYNNLWIDRLCILQDDEEDWARESSEMSNVYRNSVCTIYASCAADKNQGFSTEREETLSRSVQFKRRYCSLGGGIPSLSVSYDGPEEESPNGMLGHLADRGWIFQERFLSTRIIYFAKEQVYWECAELKADESWPHGMRYPYGRSTPYHQHHLPPELASKLEYTGSTTSFDIGKWNTTHECSWKKIIADSLSESSPTLETLSGLATDFNKNLRANQDVYVAGLWKPTILQDLCWKVEGSDIKNKFVLPEKYRAPSWSWASIDAKVGYDDDVIGGRPILLADFRDFGLSFVSNDPHGEALGVPEACDGLPKPFL
ncbi:heterokaryon incompatibility protein [Colletotrichum asianum]